MLPTIVLLFLLCASAFLYVLLRERRSLLSGGLLLLTLASGILALWVYGEARALTGVLSFALVTVLLLAVGMPLYLGSLTYLLFTSGRELIRREGRRPRNFLSFLLGALLLLGILGLPVANRYATHPLLRGLILYTAFLLCYFFLLLLVFALSSWINAMTPLRLFHYDYILVLGSGLVEDKVPPLLAGRILRGMAVYRRQNARQRFSKLVFSGGQGPDEGLPEGEAMADFAMAQGIPKEDVLVEDQSRSTRENLLFARTVLEKDWKARGMGHPFRVLVVTNRFHLFRALLLAKSLDFPCHGTGSETPFYFGLNAWIREFIGILVLHPRVHVLVAVLGLLLVLLAPLFHG